MTTLADIARDSGVSPQAVGKWRDAAIDKYGELEFEQVGRRKLYSSDAVEKILEFRTEPVSNSAVTPEVLQGNHRVIQNAPLVPQQFDLAQFRDQDSTAIDLSTADGAIQALRTIRQGLKQDLEQQWNQLATTQQQEIVLKQEMAALEQEASEYRVTSNILARLQSQSSQSVFAELQKLQSLGKPPAADGGGSPQ